MRSAWAPFRELNALRREIDRVFEGWGSGRGGPSSSAFLPRRSAREYPLMNVSEDEEAVYVHALAPGVDPDSLDVTMQGNVLTVSGEKQSLAEGGADTYHREERAAGAFSRKLRMDYEVERDDVSAEYTDGILHVTLPKAEESRPKKVDVSIK